MKEQFSRHWISGQWCLRDGKQMRWVLWLPQLTALRMFPDHGSRRGKPGRASGLPEFRGKSWELRETKAARVQRTEQRRLNKERTPEIYKDPTWVLYQHVHVRKLAKSRGKSCQKGLEITGSGVHIGPRIASVPTNETGRPHDSQSTRQNTHKGLTAVMGLALDWMQLWSHITNMKNKSVKDQTVSKLLSCIQKQSSRIFIGIQKYPAHDKG